MSRPRLISKSARIELRLEASDKKKLTTVARSRGCDLATYIRGLCLTDIVHAEALTLRPSLPQKRRTAPAAKPTPSSRPKSAP